MDKELIGQISGLIVLLSAIPYAIRAWQQIVTPNIMTWGLWSFIGFSLLLTYTGSGAEANAWPAVFGFINPTIITFIAIYRRGEIVRFTKVEVLCAVISITSLISWWWLRSNPDLVQYALYTAIAADICAAIPTLIFVFKYPEQERPFAWALFAIGYGLAIFAINEHTISNYALPLWMFFGPLVITTPLVVYRVKNRIPLKEWA